MTRAAFRQADIERILRAAKATGSIVQIDIKTLVCTILPPTTEQPAKARALAPDGKENWGSEDWSDLDDPKDTRYGRRKRDA